MLAEGFPIMKFLIMIRTSIVVGATPTLSIEGSGEVVVPYPVLSRLVGIDQVVSTASDKPADADGLVA